MSLEEAEAAHFDEVVASFLAYRVHSLTELATYCSTILKSFPRDDFELIGLNPTLMVQQVSSAITVNQQVLELIVCAHLGSIPNHLYKIPVEPRNHSKARTTLKQIVREWSTAGQVERDQAFRPILDALKDNLEISSRRPRVMCPGSGMGRLPFEICKLGFDCQGNEFSYHMIIACNLVLNTGLERDSLSVFPAVHARANRQFADSTFTAVTFPDAVPAEELIPGVSGELSLAAGEFAEVYGESRDEWDGVATCFFLDTAKNICQYIRIFAHALIAGGGWVNCGPLLYHFAEAVDDVSIEMSWSQVKPLIEKYFTIKEERMIKCQYTALEGLMSNTVYDCIFFVAVRNDEQVSGVSRSVYF